MALAKPMEWWSWWADVLGITAAILAGILALVSFVGWTFSWKAGKLKDEALKNYQTEADEKIAEANKAASIANEKAAAANLISRYFRQRWRREGSTKSNRRN